MIIVYTRAKDNRVAICHGIGAQRLSLALNTPLTEEQYREHMWNKEIPKDAINPVEITHDMIPSDWSFRDAWVHDGKSFAIDSQKACAIALEKIRIARKPLLDELDREHFKALDIGGDQELNAIREKKQVLRDATSPLKALDVSATVDDIYQAMPDWVEYKVILTSNR